MYTLWLTLARKWWLRWKSGWKVQNTFLTRRLAVHHHDLEIILSVSSPRIRRHYCPITTTVMQCEVPMKASPLSVALASAAVATSVLSTTDIPSSISAREMPFRLVSTCIHLNMNEFWYLQSTLAATNDTFISLLFVVACVVQDCQWHSRQGL
jgi:hypothetical protein